MARKKKDSKPRTFRISTDILEQLTQYSEKSGIPMSTVVDRALRQYLDNVESKTNP